METTFRFYVGATPKNNVDGMFSFVPCLPLGDPPSGFERPVIELDSFIKPRLSMAARTSDPLDATEIVPLWQRVTDQVLAKSLALATHLDLPAK